MFLRKGEVPPSEFFFVRKHNLRMPIIDHIMGVFGIYVFCAIVGSVIFHIDDDTQRTFFTFMSIHPSMVLYQRLRWAYLFGDWKGEIQQLELPLQLPAQKAAP